MKEIEELKDQVYNQGLNTLLKRMEVLIPEYKIRELVKPVIVSAEILDMEEVVKTIKSEYTCFSIKDVELNMRSQVISFKVWGSCYVPERYRGYRILNGAWSATQTEECNYQKTIKEEYAEEMVMPLNVFNNGIKVEIV